MASWSVRLFQGNSQSLSLRGFRKSSGACPTACLLSSRYTLKACKMVRRPGWSNNPLPAKEVICDIKGDTRPSWFTRLSCCFVRLTLLSALLSPPTTKKSSWTFFAAGCLCFASLWSNLRWDACKPLPSIRFTGDISSKLCRAGATGMFCSLNACCKPRPASEAATTELGFTHWMLRSPYALGTQTRIWFGHGCSGHRMLLEHKREYGLGMDALVTVCSWNTNEIMLWAWMLWSPYALGTRTRLCFGHGCAGHRMLLEHERYYDLGMDALVIVCSRNTNVIMIRAWMLW